MERRADEDAVREHLKKPAGVRDSGDALSAVWSRA
jgi:hypothetical protein